MIITRIFFLLCHWNRITLVLTQNTQILSLKFNYQTKLTSHLNNASQFLQQISSKDTSCCVLIMKWKMKKSYAHINHARSPGNCKCSSCFDTVSKCDPVWQKGTYSPSNFDHNFKVWNFITFYADMITI